MIDDTNLLEEFRLADLWRKEMPSFKNKTYATILGEEVKRRGLPMPVPFELHKPFWDQTERQTESEGIEEGKRLASRFLQGG